MTDKKTTKVAEPTPVLEISLPVESWRLLYDAIKEEYPLYAESILDTLQDAALRTPEYGVDGKEGIELLVSAWKKIFAGLRNSPNINANQLGVDLTFKLLEG